jgi:hypothetical protein
MICNASFGARSITTDIQAVTGIFLRPVAEPDTKIKAAIGNQIEHCAVLGNPDGVIERQDRDIRADAHMFCACSDRGRGHHRRGDVVVIGEMMFEDIGGAEAERFGPDEEFDYLGIGHG